MAYAQISKLDNTIINIMTVTPSSSETDLYYSVEILDTNPITLSNYIINACVYDPQTETFSLQGIKQYIIDNEWELLRQERDKKLLDSDYIIIRHREETELLTTTTTTSQQYIDWLNYRDLLRKLPQSITDIFNPTWPIEPT